MIAAVLPVEERRGFAIALMLVAFLCFTMIDTCAKWLVLSGLPPLEVAFIRYAGHLLIIAGLVGPRDWRGVARTNAPLVAVLRGGFLAGATIFNFFALRYLPLSVTSAIFFTVPLWICLLGGPMLGEWIGPRRATAVAVGFAGILIVTRPGLGAMHWAVLLSIGASLCASLYFLQTRRLAGIDSTPTQQVYAAGIGTLALAAPALLDWSWPGDLVGWLAFAAIGGFGWAGHQITVIAHRMAPATTLAPFVYLQIIFMTGAGWIVFGTVPDVWVFVGAAVVVASGLFIWMRERRLERGRFPDEKLGH
ncbi:MAG: DMT family transporter [Inquilinus sp.]|nr:DMT family transporter [Inquilinus sp.]